MLRQHSCEGGVPYVRTGMGKHGGKAAVGLAVFALRILNGTDGAVEIVIGVGLTTGFDFNGTKGFEMVLVGFTRRRDFFDGFLSVVEFAVELGKAAGEPFTDLTAAFSESIFLFFADLEFAGFATGFL